MCFKTLSDTVEDAQQNVFIAASLYNGILCITWSHSFWKNFRKKKKMNENQKHLSFFGLFLRKKKLCEICVYRNAYAIVVCLYLWAILTIEFYSVNSRGTYLPSRGLTVSFPWACPLNEKFCTLWIHWVQKLMMLLLVSFFWLSFRSTLRINV